MKKKVTIGGMTAVGALIVILLTIFEKAEAIISKSMQEGPANPMTEYSQERPFLRGQEPSQIQAKKQ